MPLLPLTLTGPAHAAATRHPDQPHVAVVADGTERTPICQKRRGLRRSLQAAKHSNSAREIISSPTRELNRNSSRSSKWWSPRRAGPKGGAKMGVVRWQLKVVFFSLAYAVE